MQEQGRKDCHGALVGFICQLRKSASFNLPRTRSIQLSTQLNKILGTTECLSVQEFSLMSEGVPRTSQGNSQWNYSLSTVCVELSYLPRAPSVLSTREK